MQQQRFWCRLVRYQVIVRFAMARILSDQPKGAKRRLSRIPDGAPVPRKLLFPSSTASGPLLPEEPSQSASLRLERRVHALARARSWS